MSKSKSQSVANGEVHGDEMVSEASGDVAATNGHAGRQEPELMTKVATVGVIAVGAALFEAALIPGMVLGVCAMLVPKALPRLGAAVQPAVRGAVRGAYKLGKQARHAFAEAHEQVQDIVAESNASSSTTPGATPQA
jgi:hypothetical protein